MLEHVKDVLKLPEPVAVGFQVSELNFSFRRRPAG